LALITISIAAVVITAGFILTDTKGKAADHTLYLKQGDYLHYEISGNEGVESLKGNMTVLEKGSLISMYGTQLPFSEEEMFQLYDHIGTWVGTHRINTTWGEKTTNLYLKAVDPDAIVITDVGIDSAIIYRTSCLTRNGTLQSVLTTSNNTDIVNADTRIDNERATGMERVLDHEGTNYTVWSNEGHYAYGSVEVKVGQALRYNMSITGGFLYVFNFQDLVDISNDGQAHYRHDVSMGWNETGPVSAMVPAGTYWYCMVVPSSYSGGSFIPYWD